MPTEDNQQQPSFADRISGLLSGVNQTAENPVQPKMKESPLANRIYNLLAGRTEFENPNAKRLSPTDTPPEERSTILGTLFAEVSNRPADKQKLEAQTILNTARNRARAHGTTILQEITRPHQYQGFGSKEYERYLSGDVRDTDKQKVGAIEQVLAQLESGTLEDNINGYQFYTHKSDGSIEATREYKYGKKSTTDINTTP